MVLWHEGVKCFSVQRVPGVSRQNAHLLQTLPQRQVLYRGGVCAHFGSKTFHEPLQGLFAKYVARPSAHVALLCVWLEAFAKVDGLVGGVVRQNPAQVVHHDVGVVVRLQEPIRIVGMVLVHVVEGSDRLPIELVTALLGAKAHRGEVWILHRAHEHHHIAMASPSGPDMASSALQVIRTSHHPTENTHFLVQHVGNLAVFIYGDRARNIV